ncbi:hypothetical protein F7725_025675 [Dissostichus mawsoni]|uniref:Uncharacterized protein n=1 Tax=Dissostichus mawsoni TaxID=36200 RepID=A0A7J5XC09_DISMA|nr:hypothetical protein F7725_025675 [Dissostichus mawsoni]
MTPLMHAAYKGKADMCRLLLQHGANVNCNQHEYGYTALMFAGLSALEKCHQVMDLLCEQCVKQQDMNEVLAMKMHYISCVLQKCLAFLQKRDDKLDALVKR